MLIEWDNTTINLKYITYILKSYKALEMYVYFGQGHYVRSSYDTKKEMDDDYTNLIKLIKTSTNLNTDSEGRFVCQHCGAPNV